MDEWHRWHGDVCALVWSLARGSNTTNTKALQPSRATRANGHWVQQDYTQGGWPTNRDASKVRLLVQSLRVPRHDPLIDVGFDLLLHGNASGSAQAGRGMQLTPHWVAHEQGEVALAHLDELAAHSPEALVVVVVVRRAALGTRHGKRCWVRTRGWQWQSLGNHN